MTSTQEYYAYLALASPSALAVDLERFEARTDGRRLSFRWRTGLEVDSLGFHLLEERAGVRRRLTRELIAGSALTVGQRLSLVAGGWYQFSVAAGPEAPGARYWLEEIDLAGRSTLHGPFAPHQVDAQLPALERLSSPLLSDLGQAPSLRRDGLLARNQWSLLPARPLRAPGQDDQRSWTVPGGAAVKLLVKQEGLYRVSQAELLAAGLDPAVDPRRLRLYTDGREVRVRIQGEDDGRLDPPDWLELYGLGLDSTFTDTRVYWLAEAAGNGRRVAKSAAPPPSPAPSGHFPFTVEQKERSVYFAALLNGEGNNFFGPLLSATPVTRTVNVHHLDPSGGGRLHLSLQGVSESGHGLQVLLNGQPLGAAVEWASRELHGAVLTLPPGSGGLVEGDNTFTFTTADAADIALLDSLRLEYPHRMVADDDAQRVTVLPGQVSTLSGFGTTDLRAFDVTEPHEVSELPVTTESRADGVSASVSPGGSGARVVLVLGGRRIAGAPTMVANRPSSLRRAQDGTEMVIITHRRLAPAAAPLQALREQQGMKVAIVDVEDIYDEFNYGHKDPATIRQFLRHARREYRMPPRFALLLGDASIDPRDHLGAGDNDLVPTRLLDVDPLQTASDDWFADFDDRRIPQMAIGRIPARTLPEAAAIIHKLVNHETGWSGDQNSALFFTDLAHEGDEFESVSRQVAGLIPPWLSVDFRVRGASPPPSGPATWMDAWNAGPLLVNYVGHGSVGLWRRSLAIADVHQLTNRGRPSLVVGMTCLNGLFQDPRNTTMAEALLAAPDAGAFAVWTSSGFNPLAEHSALNQAFVRAALVDRLPLGEAARVAKAAAGHTDASQTWILFGDPSRSLVPHVAPPAATTLPASGACTVTPAAPPAAFMAALALSVLALFRRRRPWR